MSAPATLGPPGARERDARGASPGRGGEGAGAA